jgi:uncharacterized protein with PIN domain
MSYHIPSDDQIKKALKKVLKDNRTVSSQKKLKILVTKKLNTKKKRYGVTGSRIRNIAINSDFVKLEINSREGDPQKSLNKCPVCNNPLKHVKNLTIWGGEVTIELRCNRCGYWTGKKKRIPTLYIFHIKKRK